MYEQDSSIALAKTLISEPSITPNDANCQLIISKILNQHKFIIDNWQESDGTKNMLAILDKGPPYFLYSGHTDVVPPGPLEKWHNPPFEPTITSGVLYGRGACDMKGSIAAFITAVEQLCTQGFNKGSIVIALTSDEEGKAEYGTKSIVNKIKTKNIPIDYCLVGEPTCKATLGDIIKIGRRGSLNGFAQITGTQQHVAYCKDNNILHTIDIIVNKLKQLKFPKSNQYFPETQFNITYINAGDGTTNIVPGNIDIQFNFRYSNSIDHLELVTMTDNCFKELNLPYTINWHHSANPYYHPPQELTKVLTEIINQKFSIIPEINTEGGTSDGRFLIDLNCEIAEFGLLNATIHQINENTPANDIIQLKNIYLELLTKILN